MAADVTIPRFDSLDERAAQRAVARRDARYDGRFVYAVHSTGVYCRPSCPSRRPTRSSVSFYATPEEARQSGFRACRRCRPDAPAVDNAANAVARARAHLDGLRGDGRVTLNDLSVIAGISPFHLQRSFKRLVGISPREYQESLRSDRLRSRLRAGGTISRASFDAGYGSSSRVYERAHRVLGMTPGSYKRGGQGATIAFAIGDAPVGRVLVATTARGVCSVALGASDAKLEAGLRAAFPSATIAPATREQRAWIAAALQRVRHPERSPRATVPLDVDATAFQWRVWKELRRIPAGARRSYGEIASAIGRPSAARAVARACASNQVAVLIPCHRVVRSDGHAGGYRWGVERKRSLLATEED